MVHTVSYCQKCAQRIHRRSTETEVDSIFDQHYRRANDIFEQFKIDLISIGKRSYILCVYDDNCNDRVIELYLWRCVNRLHSEVVA